MPSRAVLTIVACVALMSAALPAHAAEKHHAACTKAHARECVIHKHELAIAATYFQNASRIGGTALASYPLVRVRYGLLPNAEVFYDAANELAISSHGGHYVMVHPGWGAQGTLATSDDAKLMLTAESRPPLDPLQNLYLVPLSEVHLTGLTTPSDLDATSFSGQVGTLNFIASQYGRRRTSLFGDLGATQPVGDGTWFTGELGLQSHATFGAAGATRGIASVKRTIGNDTLFNVDLGTTFNASGNSKPHYLGAGVTFLR
jgi:hypothetical protein